MWRARMWVTSVKGTRTYAVPAAGAAAARFAARRSSTR
jgi:hypothetical protein